MSNNIRIRTTVNDANKYVNLQLDQKFDFIEILSLKISQEDVYKRYCSDYGVVVGRVTVNNGYGVPNAKVSIFIPISDTDKEDPQIYGLYPYELTTDKNVDGYRYNLLPKTNETNNDCFTQTGSFFTKREIQDNDDALDIYCKYYKFTTVTNAAGDFMFFGVPVGSYTIQVDADISDIGSVSQRPYDLIREGSNPNQFYSNSKFKSSENLTTLTQIKTVTASVDVSPFWGDIEQCSIGISRTDIDLATNVTPSAIFMGSIFGDSEKNSVNKQCRPRKKLGSIGEMTTGEGTIEMIRKASDGTIERFDIDGAQLIDDAGTWAYQVPMNLDYVITDEYGNLVPTDDPNKGIPTRARVRFRVGMGNTGNEGRLRRRAKYLIPHNPKSWADSDYSFGDTTKDSSFTDFYWNKIYTVANHITRVQNTNVLATKSRTFIGLKEVDEGSNNPFPFNRMDTNLNPLFVVLCVVMSIIAFLVIFLNKSILPFINFVFIALNTVLKGICRVLNALNRAVCVLQFKARDEECIARGCIAEMVNGRCDCNKPVISYISYVLMSCDEKKYCMGCLTKNGPSNMYLISYKATKERNNNEFFEYPDRTAFNKWNDTTPNGDAGWTNCMAIVLADSLDAFKLDFYSDWVNGTLYSFLIKYKVRKRGKGAEKFCEIDCGSSTGVDNNKNGVPDNSCTTNYIIDTCTNVKPQGTSDSTSEGEYYNSIKIKEGVIKKFDGELYYAAYSKNSAYKLFATKIINLGSVFDCDWQGVPKMYQYLTDTTFNKPSLTNIYYGPEDVGHVDGGLLESGFDSPGDKLSQSLMCNIGCFKIQVGSQQCNNIKRLCEYGIGLDEDRTDDGGKAADFKITNSDIENQFVRGLFTYLNNNNPNKGKLINLIGIDKTEYMYDDTNYANFRGVIKNTIWQYEYSYYFYFGLVPGKTALQKLNNKYFPTCERVDKPDMSIIVNEIVDDNPTGDGIGSISISIVGGAGPFIYEWQGPTLNGVKFSCCYDESIDGPCAGTKNSCGTGNYLNNLVGGTYVVTVTDVNGLQATVSVVVGGFVSVECSAQPRPVNASGAGKVYIDIVHGTAPYDVIITQVDENQNDIPGKTYTLPQITSIPNGGYCYGFCEVVKGDSPSMTNTNLVEGSYKITVTDNGKVKTECVSYFTITKPETIIISVTSEGLICNNSNDGVGEVTIEGGTPPYSIEWRLKNAPQNYTHQSLINNSTTKYYVNSTGWNVIAPTNLFGGLYEVNVTDLGGNVVTSLVTVPEPKEIGLKLNKVAAEVITETETGFISVNINGDNPPFNLDVDGDTTASLTDIQNGDYSFNVVGSTAPYNILVTDANGCENSVKVTIPVANPLTSFANEWIEPKIVEVYGYLCRYHRITASGGVGFNDKWVNIWRSSNVRTASPFYNANGSYCIMFYKDSAGNYQLYTGGWIKMNKNVGYGVEIDFYMCINANTSKGNPLDYYMYSVADNNLMDTFTMNIGYSTFNEDGYQNGEDSKNQFTGEGGYTQYTGRYAYINKDNTKPKLYESNTATVAFPNISFPIKS